MTIKRHKDYQGIIKANQAAEAKPIALNPIKVFNPPKPQVKPGSTLAKNWSNKQPISKEKNLNSDKEIPKHTHASSHIQTTQKQPEFPTISHADLLAEAKEDINSEVQSYKEEQISSMKQDVISEIATYKKDQLNSVQDDLETLKKSTYQEAYNKGLKDAKQILDSKANELLESINQLSQSKKEDINKHRDFIITLSTAMAERIIKQKVELKPEVFNSMFQEAFDKITDKDHVIIEINPEDEALLLTYKDTFSHKFKDIDQLDIRTNETISRGGCTIETKLGYIEATVNSKLDLLIKSIDAFHQREDDAHAIQNSKVVSPESDSDGTTTNKKDTIPASNDSFDDSLFEDNNNHGNNAAHADNFNDSDNHDIEDDDDFDVEDDDDFDDDSIDDDNDVIDDNFNDDDDNFDDDDFDDDDDDFDFDDFDS